MSPIPMFDRWHATVKALLPELHAYQQEALATFSFALARALHCHLGRAAVVAVGSATPRSVERRFQRYLANDRIVVRHLSRSIARQLLAHWTGQRIVLVLDEVPLGNRLRCLRISVAWRGRAVPLVWCCYRPDAPPMPLPRLIRLLCRRVALCLPSHAQTILLADRGLSWPSTLDAARRHRWHFVLRLQRQTRVRFPDASEHNAVSLLDGGATPIFAAEGLSIFKDAGWRAANVVAVWQGSDADAWLLATDLPPERSVCDLYRQRMWFEESNRDEKSSGFDWQKSRVWDPAHAERLLLAVALATVWLLSVGARVLTQGLQTRFEPGRRRLYSVFQLGWRWLHWALSHDHTVSTAIAFFPSFLDLPPPC